MVFSGLVTRITPIERDFRETISFNIEKSFKGVTGTVVELTETGTSCDYSFEQGEKYLVYAYRHEETNTLYSHYCTRTKEFSKAGAELDYLNSLGQKPQPPEIVGLVADGDKRLRRISVVARNGTSTYRTVSDDKGWFHLRPPPGKYHVTIFLPLYSSVGGTAEELAPIDYYRTTKTARAVGFEVSVEPGKCSFIHPPLMVFLSDYEKHRGTYPVPRKSARARRAP